MQIAYLRQQAYRSRRDVPFGSATDREAFIVGARSTPTDHDEAIHQFLGGRANKANEYQNHNQALFLVFDQVAHLSVAWSLSSSSHRGTQAEFSAKRAAATGAVSLQFILVVTLILVASSETHAKMA
jgi:hypothetical protein